MGHSTRLRVFVDPGLLQYDIMWAAARTWNDNFSAAPADIARFVGGVELTLASRLLLIVEGRVKGFLHTPLNALMSIREQAKVAPRCR